MDNSHLGLKSEIANFARNNLKRTETTIYYLNGKTYVSNDAGAAEKRVDMLLDEKKISYLNEAGRICYDYEIDKIIDRLNLSSDCVATDLNILKESNISHIVNVTTNVPNKFEPEIVYKNVNICDFSSENIYAHFKDTYEFIEQALNSDEKHSVLVHCNMGISRSSSIIIAYLLQKRIFNNYNEAFKYVKSKRPKINPNDGFYQQLIQLENELNTSNA